MQGEEHEGRGGEAEGGLRCEVGKGVVVGFVGRGAGAVGGDEEGTDVAADVWGDVSVMIQGDEVLWVVPVLLAIVCKNAARTKER